MPVHFKGQSEYERHYKWHDSFRSRTFKPSPEQLASTAGLHSSLLANIEPALQSKKRVEPVFLKTTPAKSEFDGVPLQSKKRVQSPSQKPTPAEPVMQAKKRVIPDFAKTAPVESANPTPIQSKKKVDPVDSEKTVQSEPPLQSKKRAPGPTTSLTNGFYEHGGAGDEYALLGNQEKFSQNVKYRPRSAVYSRDISPPKQMKLQQKYKENRAPSPSPAPVVDTEMYKQPPTPLAPRKPKDQSDPAIQQLKETNVVKEPKVSRSPKQSKSEPILSKTRKDEDRDVHKTEQPKVDQEISKDHKPKLEPSQEPKLSKQAGILKHQKESDLRLNLGKGEEARNFDRADPVKDSMKSKKIIENMNEFAQTNMEKGVADSAPEAPADYALRYKTGISAPRPSKKMSEYQKQFQWKEGLPASPLLKAEQVVYNSNPQLSPPKKSVIPKVTEYQKQYKAYKLVPVHKDDTEIPVAPKRSKLQKSKSMEDLSPAEIRPAGSSPVISPYNKRLTLETDQKLPEPVPEVPKRKSRQVRSEYSSNFKEPRRYDYLRGSWHGAAQPHVKLQGPEPVTQAPAVSNWFAEVIELRRKAQEYRMRALGTHFSREHMAQLMARQNELWDASTPSARSTLSALSLESGLSSYREVKPPAPQEEPGKVKDYSVIASLASEDDQSSARLHEFEQREPRQAWADQEESNNRRNQQTPSTFSEEESRDEGGVEGRQPTPKLREQVRSGKSPTRRHHLDRTTPTVGGAILSSPPDTKKKRSGKRMVCRSVDSASLGTMEEETPREEEVSDYRPLAGQKTYSLSANQGIIAPSPTFGMPSRDTHALRDDGASSDRELHTKFVYTPVKAKETPGGLGAIQEGFGETYNKSKPVNKPDRKSTSKPFSWTIDGGLPIPRIDEDDGVLSVSMQSIASSCSLASDTLERARKRKEEFWGSHTVKAK